MLVLLIVMLLLGLGVGLLAGAVRGFREAWKKSRAVRVLWTIVAAIYCLGFLIALAVWADGSLSRGASDAINAIVMLIVFGGLGILVWCARRRGRP